jgi:hypothetical protein
MPSIRHPLHYPAEYFKLIELAAIKGQTTTVPCSSPKHALKLRGHFYAFVGALKRGGDEYKEQYGWSQQTMCYLQDSTLHFIPREKSWQAETIRAAFAAAPPAEPTITEEPAELPPGIAQYLEKNK